MKVFLTGSTGNIGSGVLEACLRDPTVTAIVALSRRPLEVEDPKLKVIINDDFSTYSEEVLEEALSSDGAIWCLGVLSHQDKTQEEKLRITKGSITAFLEAFIPKLLASPPRGSPWRLVWLGGMIVVRDQNASVWILSHIRKEFGKIVNEIASYADRTRGRMEIYFSHIGFVYPKGSWATPFQRYVMRGIRKDEHGFATLSVVESGCEKQDLFNPEMKILADQYVKRKSLRG